MHLVCSISVVVRRPSTNENAAHRPSVQYSRTTPSHLTAICRALSQRIKARISHFSFFLPFLHTTAQKFFTFTWSRYPYFPSRPSPPFSSFHCPSPPCILHQSTCLWFIASFSITSWSIAYWSFTLWSFTSWVMHCPSPSSTSTSFSRSKPGMQHHTVNQLTAPQECCHHALGLQTTPPSGDLTLGTQYKPTFFSPIQLRALRCGTAQRAVLMAGGNCRTVRPFLATRLRALRCGTGCFVGWGQLPHRKTIFSTTATSTSVRNGLFRWLGAIAAP